MVYPWKNFWPIQSANCTFLRAHEYKRHLSFAYRRTDGDYSRGVLGLEGAASVAECFTFIIAFMI
jgi:hypothetical protein